MQHYRRNEETNKIEMWNREQEQEKYNTEEKKNKRRHVNAHKPMPSEGMGVQRERITKRGIEVHGASQEVSGVQRNRGWKETASAFRPVSINEALAENWTGVTRGRAIVKRMQQQVRHLKK